MAHSLPRDAAVQEEVTFQAVPAWGGSHIKVIEPALGIEQALDENANIKPRRQAILDLIPGLKSDSTFAAGIYMTASGVNAADQAPAAATPESMILLSAFGGRKLGFRAALDGAGSAAAPSVAADPGYVAGDWVFAYDASEATGVWRQIDDVTALVLTLLDPLPAAPDAADILYAGIAIYSDELNHDHTAAGYTTLAWLVQGEHPDDVFEMLGCKPTVGIEGFEAGGKLKYTLDHMVANWPAVMPSKQVLAGAASGIAPHTVATGTATTVQLSDVGSPLADVDCRGTIDIDPGVTWAKVSGACGAEGVKGYVSETTAATITIRVAFDDVAYVAEYVAGTKKRMLIQNGDQPTDSTGVYFGSLEYAARPKRADEGGVTITELSFRAHEDPGAVGALTGDNLAQRRAPFIFLHAG